VMLDDEMIDEASRKMALVISGKGRAAGMQPSVGAGMQPSVGAGMQRSVGTRNGADAVGAGTIGE